jgi:hypothetical protein
VRGFPSAPIGVVKLVAVGLSTVGRSLVVMGFPSTPLGMVMLVPVPLSLTEVGSGAGVVGCCAKATPVSVTVDTIANDVIQAVRVMIVTSLSYILAAGGPVPDYSRKWAHPTARCWCEHNRFSFGR